MTFPVLRIFDPALPVVLFTDSSDVHVGGGLTQRLPAGELVAIAYYSRSLRGPELSYPIQHKEALAIVSSVMAFVHYLLAAHFTVRTCSDHKSLETCFAGMSKVACDRVTRWVQKLCNTQRQLAIGCAPYSDGYRNISTQTGGKQVNPTLTQHCGSYSHQMDVLFS